MVYRTTVLMLALFTASAFVAAYGQQEEANRHQFETKVRFVYLDRDFGNDANDRTQTALGFEGNYLSPRFADFVAVGLSAYVAGKIDADGAVVEDLLTVNDGELDGFALLGQSFLDLALGDAGSVKGGRTLQKSMFLASSGARALPDTYQGANIQFGPGEGFSIYGMVYDKWSRRARDDFESFATDVSAEGDIDWVGIAGLRYASDVFSAELEYLRSDDYLGKLGLRGSYLPDIGSDNGKLKLTGGVFTSKNDGDLFVVGAAGKLDDEDLPGSVAGVTPSENDGLGGYVDVEWRKAGFTVGATLTLIDEIWLESNFTGDHGTNPFPTAAAVSGADLTNTGETVWGGRIGYDWPGIVEGLSTTLQFVDGSGAENTVSPALGTADERWWQIDVRYKVPVVSGLSLHAIYHDYTADETGSVDGVGDDDRDIRLYVDYVHRF